jgi:4-hydroxy-3-polyprenylbenzoate decarboxylase
MSAEASPRVPRYTVAVTGASGALYAVRTVAALLEQGCELDLVVSDYGRRLLVDELGKEAALERLMPYLEQRYGAGVRRGRFDVIGNRDLGATIASGSRPTKGMVIVPCSMKSLAGVANGLSRNLVERAADVMLKERKPLVLVPRETPMSLPQLRNMVLCAEAGAVVLPAMPGFYHLPKTLDDVADFLAGKILSSLRLEQRLCADWTGRVDR